MSKPTAAGCRAKFYVFEKDHWQEKGTGNVTCLIPKFGQPTIVMEELSSTNDSTIPSCNVLLVSKITFEDSYRLDGLFLHYYDDYYEPCIWDADGRCVILWHEKDAFIGGDIACALSFKDTAGCWSVWKSLMSVQPGYHLQKDGKLMITHSNEKTYEMIRAGPFHNQKPFLPWHSIQMTTWQSRLWGYRVWYNGDRNRKKWNMRPPVVRPRELIFCSNMVESSSPIEPLFHDWFISHVISFLDLPAIVKLDTALSCFTLRKRWIEALPMVSCPSGVDNFELHAKESVQWLISRRLKISRLSVTPWYMYTHGGAAGLEEEEGDATCIFKDFNLGFFEESLKTLEIATTGKIEGVGFSRWGPFIFEAWHGDDNETISCLLPLSTCKALQSLSLEFSDMRSPQDDGDFVPLLSGCHQLKKLKLKYAEDMTDAVLQVLARDCRQLEDVEIVLYSPREMLSYGAFAALVTQLPLLRRLVLDFINDPNGSSKAMLPSLIQCPLLEELFLSRLDDEIKDQDVRGLIQRCNKLTKLGFYMSSALKESHFEEIGKSTSITSLSFSECEGCTDDALAALARDGRLQLKEITIMYDYESQVDMPITDTGVETLATRFAASLESVTLKHCINVTDDGLAVLAICPHLRSIEVDECRLITGAFLEPLTDSCCDLEKIACFGSNVNFQAIADRCPLLRDITLCHATDEKVALLVRGCPLLTHVRLYGKQLSDVSDVSLAAIAAGLPHLEVLSIDRSRYSSISGLTEASLYNLLQKCPHITFLNTGVKITDPDLRRMILQRRILVAGFFNH